VQGHVVNSTYDAGAYRGRENTVQGHAVVGAEDAESY
jgi:hypothetical protein